jgi:hypothetical protein
VDVIGFLCAPLVSSTVQLIYSVGSRRACGSSDAGFSSENGERTWGVYYRRATSSCAFLFFFCGQKNSVQRIFIKKYFLYKMGSIHRVSSSQLGREIRRWCPTRSPWCRSGWDNSQNTLLCCGFRRTGKAMGQVCQCWWRLCRETNFFFRLEYHMSYVLYPFVTYLLTLPRI